MAKKYSFLLKSSMVVLGLVFGAGFYTGHALADEKEVKKAAEEKVQKAADEKVKEVDEAKWEEQAERSFGVGRGLGKKLMTKEEWREHQRKMQSMTPEEKEAYRNEVHAELRERAKEKGIDMPDEPGPHGKGMMDGKGKMMDGKGKMMDGKGKMMDGKGKGRMGGTTGGMGGGTTGGGTSGGY